ncbi:MAG: glutamine--fructose-6-phosphate transaminase (isomerizing) [Candidatus Kerfeldbacteria bacterium]
MCGIIGYLGKSQAKPVILEGLKRMEYRGYDSAGLAILEDQNVKICKRQGKLSNLLSALESQDVTGSVGIGHIRWATHGEPSDVNAHPHSDCRDEVFIVHNGIIENYPELKKKLQKKNHTFTTETDTEVLAHLIEMHHPDGVSLEDAVQAALKEVVGAYGIAVVSSRDPEKIVAARLGSPLVLGIIGEGEFIIASDVTAILPYTREVIYMDEGEIATVTPDGYSIKTLDNKEVSKTANRIEWDIAEAEKQGYPHFMLKEIMEQPDVIKNGLRGRLLPEEGLAHLGGFIEKQKEWRKIKRIILVACGSASYAATVGEYMLEEYAGISVEVEVGSEFRYRQPVIDDMTAVIVVSQSGETADTIASLREAKRHGALTFGIVNVVGSTIAREVDSGAYVHAGPEIAVASTKAYVGMLNMFALLTIALGRQRGMSVVTGQRIAKELWALPNKIKKVLEQSDDILQIAKKYQKLDHAFYLGRKYNFGTAKEGAQKMKEISYVHAEGYQSGELKHGPLALIDDRFYSVFIAPKDSVFEKNLSNLQELRARNGKAIVLTTEGTTEFDDIADDVITIPKTLEMLTPILAIIPLQLLAYHTAVLRKCDVDQPRNLAKSVTVE